MVPLNFGRTGLSSLRSNRRLYARHGLPIANGIIDVPPSGPALVVIANYRKTEDPPE